MTKYEISVDKETCIGCGACSSCDNFNIGDDGKSEPVKKEVTELGCNQAAADECPVKAIKVKEAS